MKDGDEKERENRKGKIPERPDYEFSKLVRGL